MEKLKANLIEFKQLNLQDTADAIEKLIAIVLYETNTEIFREIFRAIENLFLYNSAVNVSLQPLIDEMEHDESILANTLLILPFTSKNEYIVLAELYLNHQNELVRKNAAYALKYLKGTR
jgi:vesicle coat complex subunit